MRLTILSLRRRKGFAHCESLWNLAHATSAPNFILGLHRRMRRKYASAIPSREIFSADLERRKLEQLTEMIERSFGIRPKLYRAGRYGAGENTSAILEGLRYEVDCSVLPGQPAGLLGPDYSGGIARPYWLGKKRSILEIPVTVATLSLAGQFGDTLYGQLASPLGRTLKIPGVMARLGIMERIRLTPEGTTLEEASA